MNRARDIELRVGWLSGGVRFYPYQMGIGASISLWPSERRPEISLHVGPFKFWLGISGQKVFAYVKSLLPRVTTTNEGEMVKTVIKINGDEGRVVIDRPKHRLSDKDIISNRSGGKPGKPKETA